MTRGSGLRDLLGRNLAAVALIFALLEFWRPCYFLTDDNLDGGLPMLAGMGRRILHGESPFISDSIYGGDFNLLRDCTYFHWHPIYLIAAVVAATPAWYLAIELIALFFVMVGAAGFVSLAHFLRMELKLQLSDGRLMFYTLSFSFSMIVLCTGSSWVSFLGNNSAMPWLALGILQTSWRRGLGLVSLFSVHHLLAGHLEAAVSTTLFLTLFAIGVAFCRGSVRPLVWWFGGYAIALVLISPLAVPAMEGFFASQRAGGLVIGWMNMYAMPAMLIPFSLLLSTLSARLGFDYQFAYCPVAYSCAFASCAAGWALIPALTSRSPWTRLEILCLALVALATMLVIRPVAVSQVLIHLPLLRSMRWPFREILQLQFFLHLFLVLRPQVGTAWLNRSLVWLGALLFLLPLPFLPAPSFNLMSVDRGLLFSGRAEKYWGSVRALLGPDDVLVPVANPAVFKGSNLDRVPFSLFGAGDYPILFRVRSASGYSLTVPRDQLYVQAPAMNIWGIYDPAKEPQILAERPNVRFITIESVDPLRITLSSKSGPPLDLMPLLPAALP